MNNRELIEQIDTRSLVEKVEGNLVKLLQEKKLKVGDPIPKELELADILGVSRTVIREALVRLRVMGLIETKKKKGTVITSPDVLSILEKSLNPHILNEETLREMFELRLALEIGMADFIFSKVTAEDIAELRKIIESEPEHTDDFAFHAEQEIAFHGKLYEITGNSTMKKFQKMLLPIFEYVHNSGLLNKTSPVKKFVSHKGIVDVIENGSPELLRNAMRNHLENHFQRLSGTV
ncbi:FadR/GntR family transcriptional regulator [Pedobacter sp.]